MQHMGMVRQKVPTPTVPRQLSTIHLQIPPPQMNTSGIPVYQLYALEIQELLSQTTLTSLGDIQVSAQESKADNVSTYFKVLEGDKQQMKKMSGLEDTAGDDQFTKWHKELFVKNQDEKDKSQVISAAIKKCYIFDYAKVPLYPTLVKKIVKK